MRLLMKNNISTKLDCIMYSLIATKASLPCTNEDSKILF